MSIASSFVKRIGEMVNFKLSKEIQKDVFFVLSRVRDNTLKDEGDLRKRCALYLQRFHTWCFPVCNALQQSRQRRHTHLMSPSAALQTSAPCYSGTDPHTPKDYSRYRTSSVNYQMNKKTSLLRAFIILLHLVEYKERANRVQNPRRDIVGLFGKLVISHCEKEPV